MSLDIQVLGRPGRDNALYLRVDSGQHISRLLFDCGEACLYALSRGEIQDVDEVFFSHFHMDHVCGFDTLFRANFSRGLHVWGPPGTIDVMHHRFRGFLWNLHKGRGGQWSVHETDGVTLKGARFRLREAFETAHRDTDRPLDGNLVQRRADYEVRAIALDHRTISMGWRVNEPKRLNVDPDRLQSCGIAPGPWLQKVKNFDEADDVLVEAGGKETALGELREKLLVESGGDSVAYLTDFRLDADARTRLIPFLDGCHTVICEAQYLGEEGELASRNYHSTVEEVAELAKAAGIKRLVLFHLSDRYQRDQWREMLARAQAIFPATEFPEHWRDRLGV